MPGSGGRNRMPLYVVSAVIILVTAYVATRDRTPPLAPHGRSGRGDAHRGAGDARCPRRRRSRRRRNPGQRRSRFPTPVPAPAAPQTATPSRRQPCPRPFRPRRPLELTVGRNGPELRLTFERESWVEVRNGNGNLIFAQLNPGGSVRIVRGLPPLSLVVGNASGVSLTFKGKAVDLAPHTRTDVARLTLE